MWKDLFIVMISSIISFVLSKIGSLKTQSCELKNDIRINWCVGGMEPSKIYITNEGTPLNIISFKNLDNENIIVDTSATSKWRFPLYFSREFVRIPLLRRIANVQDKTSFEIMVENNKGNCFSCEIIVKRDGVNIGKVRPVFCWQKKYRLIKREHKGA